MRPYVRYALILLLFFSVCGTGFVSAQPPAQDIQVSPSTITIKLSKKVMQKAFPVELSITLNALGLNPDTKIVDVFADTFFEEEDRGPPISSKILKFTINQINISNINRVEILVIFNLPINMLPGSYNSKIYVTSLSGSIVSIPINLKVSESRLLVGLWITVGVILNLILFTIKDVVDERQNLRETIYRTEEGMLKAHDSICKAITDNRMDDFGEASNYIRAHIEFSNMIRDWNKSIDDNAMASAFIPIEKKANRIERIANEAKKTAEEIESSMPEFALPPDYSNRKNPEERLKYNPVYDYLLRSRSLQYFAILITFGIIVVSTWQTYLNEATVFGASGFADYFAALLFGFGSQTVLSQGIGMAKSWAEFRST